MATAGTTIPATAHTYASIGNDTVSVTVTDADNNTSNTAAFGVTVGLRAWLTPASAATWNAGNQTLTIISNATIDGDSSKFGDDPIICNSGNAGNLTVDTLAADGGDGDAVVHIAAIGGNGTTVVNAGSSLDVGNFSQAELANNGTVEIDGAGTIGQITGNGNLTIGNGSSANLVQLVPAAIANSVSNRQAAVTISSGSTLDITDNALLLNYGNASTPLAAVQNAVNTGAIISSTVATGNPGQYAVGYADAAEIATVPGGNVEVMYTLTGDARLTESVNFLDYSALQNNYNQTVPAAVADAAARSVAAMHPATSSAVLLAWFSDQIVFDSQAATYGWTAQAAAGYVL